MGLKFEDCKAHFESYGYDEEMLLLCQDNFALWIEKTFVGNEVFSWWKTRLEATHDVVIERAFAMWASAQLHSNRHVFICCVTAEPKLFEDLPEDEERQRMEQYITWYESAAGQLFRRFIKLNPVEPSTLKILDFLCADMPAKRMHVETIEPAVVKNDVPVEVATILPVDEISVPNAISEKQPIPNIVSFWAARYTIGDRYFQLSGWKNQNKKYISILYFLKNMAELGAFLDLHSRELLPEEITFLSKLQKNKLRQIFGTEKDWRCQKVCDVEDLPKIIKDNPDMFKKFDGLEMRQVIDPTVNSI